MIEGSIFDFQMMDPGRYLQCIRTLRDYAGKGCWEAQVCDLKERNNSDDDSIFDDYSMTQPEPLCLDLNFFFPEFPVFSFFLTRQVIKALLGN